MTSFNVTIPKKKTSFLIKDILSDDIKTRDGFLHNFTSTSRRFNNPPRDTDIRYHDTRTLFHGNESPVCSCHRSGALLGCTVPLPIRTPSPKFSCRCQVSTPRGRCSQDFLCCQPQRFNPPPQHLSPLPTRRFPSPHQIKREEIEDEAIHSMKNITESSLSSRPTDPGMFKLITKYLHLINPF